jgi:hypothetical protein
LWVLTWPFMAKPASSPTTIDRRTLRFVCNVQLAIAQTAFAEHNLEEGVDVGCACGKGACSDLISLCG